MLAIRSAMLLSIFVASTAISLAAEFPTAPPRLKDAEAQGLVRMSTTELKEFLPGKVESQGPLGGRVKTFKADGSVDRTAVGQKEGTEGSGTWRFDEQNNVYCEAFQEKRRYRDECFAVIRAPDSTHYFDYEVKTGFFTHAWRRATE